MGLVQTALHPAGGVGDGALRDGDAIQFPQHPRQSLEADMVAVVEIQQQRPPNNSIRVTTGRIDGNSM